MIGMDSRSIKEMKTFKERDIVQRERTYQEDCTYVEPSQYGSSRREKTG